MPRTFLRSILAAAAFALAASASPAALGQSKPAPRAPEVVGDAVIITFPDGTRQGSSVMPDGRVYNRKLGAGEALFADGDLYQVSPGEAYRRASGEWRRLQQGEAYVPPRDRRIIVSARDTQPLPAGVKPPPRRPDAEKTAGKVEPPVVAAPRPITPPPVPAVPVEAKKAPVRPDPAPVPEARVAAAPRSESAKPAAPQPDGKGGARADEKSSGIATYPGNIPMRPGDSLPEGAILTANDPYRLYQVRRGHWVEVRAGEAVTIGDRRFTVTEAPTLEERQAITIAASNAGLYSASHQMEFLRRRKP